MDYDDQSDDLATDSFDNDRLSDPPNDFCSTADDCLPGDLCVGGLCEPQSTSDGICRSIEAGTQAVRRPADIILLIDSSSSMGESRDRIAEVIDESFDAILDASGIDYRVILIADVEVLTLNGDLAQYDPPRLFHINIGTGSGPSTNFTQLLDNFDTAIPGPSPVVQAPWSSFLRRDAVKIFLHFNDATSGDGSTIEGYSGTFDSILYSIHPEHFGASAEDRKLIYHAFVGVEENEPADAPYEPSDPLITSSCEADDFAPRPGEGFQTLAMRTGGLRYPVCYFSGYDNVFRRIADSVIDFSTLECTFNLPVPPADETLNLATVAVRYNPGNGAPEQVFLQTASSSCDETSFVIDEVAGILEVSFHPDGAKGRRASRRRGELAPGD